MKDSTSGDFVAHSEWFCKHLGDRVGIASPECRLVEVNGETAFGSRWESGHDPENWWLRAKNAEIDVGRISPTISRILAFDLFVNNEDRHASNYIVRPQVNGDWSFLAFDHSRAWRAAGWPLPPAPMSDAVQTLSVFKAVHRVLGGILDKDEFMFVINKLREVPKSYINNILTAQHDGWLSEQKCNATIDFWQSDAFSKRIDAIEEGLNNDEYV